MITKHTAMDIALAYREIETGEELLKKIEETRHRHTPPDIRDAFGRVSDGLRLGVPSGETSHQMFNVPWSLAKPIIEAHIATERAKIRALTEKARHEINAPEGRVVP